MAVGRRHSEEGGREGTAEEALMEVIRGGGGGSVQCPVHLPPSQSLRGPAPLTRNLLGGKSLSLFSVIS